MNHRSYMPLSLAEEIAMIDAAMAEMSNISPPLKRRECQRLVLAALSASEGQKAAHAATSSHDAARCAAGTCTFYAEVKHHIPGCRQARASGPQADAGAAPKGWRLVPVEPTPEMRTAAAHAWLDCGSKLVIDKAAAAARAAIAAAHQLPAAPTAAHARQEGDGAA